jgi:murein L,D-transpeptidase YafK
MGARKGSIVKNGLKISIALAVASISAWLINAQSLAPNVPVIPVNRIIVDKSDRTMVLMDGEKAVRTYTEIKLGDAPVGPKQFEGDEKTPEGEYVISGRNPQSRYHLSIKISYPNAKDRAFAAAAGRSPGGDIFIHGQPNNAGFGTIGHDWTDGCVALSNRDMDEVWALVKTGTPILIQP